VVSNRLAPADGLQQTPGLYRLHALLTVVISIRTRSRLTYCFAAVSVASADTMEAELEPILAQDAGSFVMKLKRLIIYECERTALTSQT
jgi:hypothetical protein